MTVVWKNVSIRNTSQKDYKKRSNIILILKFCSEIKDLNLWHYCLQIYAYFKTNNVKGKTQIFLERERKSYFSWKKKCYSIIFVLT